MQSKSEFIKSRTKSYIYCGISFEILNKNIAIISMHFNLEEKYLGNFLAYISSKRVFKLCFSNSRILFLISFFTFKGIIRVRSSPFFS
jgi:hypothetical protein